MKTINEVKVAAKARVLWSAVVQVKMHLALVFIGAQSLCMLNRLGFLQDFNARHSLR